MEFPKTMEQVLEENSVAYYAEFRSTSNVLSSILVVDSHEAWKKIKVQVDENSITVFKNQKQYRYVFDDLELLPLSCRGLKYNQIGELYFSIQGKLLNADANNDTEIYRERKFSFQNKIIDEIKLYQNKWFCSICQQKLMKDMSFFSRVLPLPSENWSDFADMWFCHKHDESNTTNGHCGSQQDGKLFPKQRDCLVGDTYALVCGSQVNSGAVKVNKSGAITCSRCGHQIGVTLGNSPGNGHTAYKVYLFSLLIKDLQTLNFKHIQDNNRSRSEKFFSLLLQEQSQIYTSFRFIVESSVQTTANQTITSSTSYCLIWLMDSSVSMYASNTDSKENGSDNNGVRNNLERENILKILFQCQLSTARRSRISDVTTKSVISLWKKDNTVQSLPLPHPVFLQLVDMLIRNTKSLPTTQRILNGFYVSFLRQPEMGT